MLPQSTQGILIPVLKGILPADGGKDLLHFDLRILLPLSLHLLRDGGVIGGHKIFRWGFYTQVDQPSAYEHVGAYAILICINTYQRIAAVED